MNEWKVIWYFPYFTIILILCADTEPHPPDLHHIYCFREKFFPVLL